MARNQRVHSVATLGVWSTKRGVHANYRNMGRQADLWVEQVNDRSKGDRVVDFALVTENKGKFPSTYIIIKPNGSRAGCCILRIPSGIKFDHSSGSKVFESRISNLEIKTCLLPKYYQVLTTSILVVHLSSI